MKSWLILLIVLGSLVVDLIVVWAILTWFTRSKWNPLAEHFPAQLPAEDALTRKFQSFSVGAFNLGFSIHVTVDDRFLHLHPVAFLRWFGARPASIPWEAITLLGPARFGSAAKARIGPHEITGPNWCLALAAPELERESESK